MISALSFGEILWDIIEGEAHIGGATFNLAAHLSKMGAELPARCGDAIELVRTAIIQYLKEDIFSVGIMAATIDVIDYHRPVFFCHLYRGDGSRSTADPKSIFVRIFHSTI